MLSKYILHRDVGVSIFAHSNKYVHDSAVLDGNAKNLQAVQETNAWNATLAREQREYDYNKWKEELAYNTPAAQMARYQEAGINPYMAVKQTDSGNASSSAGGQSAATMQAPQMDVGAIASAANTKSQLLQDSILSVGQNAKTFAEAQQIMKQNEWYDVNQSADLALKTGNRELLSQAIQSAMRENNFGNTTYGSRVNQYFGQEELQRNAITQSVLQNDNLGLDLDLKKFQRDYMNPQQLENLKQVNDNLKQDYKLSVARTYAEYVHADNETRMTSSQIALNSQSIAESMARQLKTEAEKYGIDINNEVLRDTKETIKKKAKADLEYLNQQTNESKSRVKLNDSQIDLNKSAEIRNYIEAGKNIDVPNFLNFDLDTNPAYSKGKGPKYRYPRQFPTAKKFLMLGSKRTILL